MKKLTKYLPLAAALIFIVLLELSFLLIHIRNPTSKISNDQYKPKLDLSNIRKETPQVFEYIRLNLKDIINNGGIPGVVELTKEAFKQEAITMYECHTLGHIIGHYSNLDIAENIHVLIENGVDFCEGGFKHGLEAEIALRGLEGDYDFRPEVYRFCDFLLENSLIGDCYHGAGHEFMGYTRDPEKALSLCDTLDQGPLKDTTNCYTGAFSEYTNLLGGVDGETGYLLSNGPFFELKETPIEFCASLSESHQIPCVLEVGGYGFGINSTPETLERALNNCTSGKHKNELQAACIHSATAVYYQHQLTKETTIIPPDYISALSTELQMAYIAGAGTEMKQFIINGVNKDWKTFCNSFPNDGNFCKEIFVGK